jgi:cyclopropane fatty-acyl-phospholipid synthase-like methyltransferase
MHIRLNLGCGTDIQQGYENIDTRDLPGVIKADVRDLPYESNSVDEIRAIDVYEHISFRESQRLLNHWVSLLKPRGRLIIQSPSIEVLARNILMSTSVEEIESSIASIFGNQDYKENSHFTACHPELMVYYLRNAGITREINCHTKSTNLVINARK